VERGAVDERLENPDAMVKGTAMEFRVPKAEEREAGCLLEIARPVVSPVRGNDEARGLWPHTTLGSAASRGFHDTVDVPISVNGQNVLQIEA
jgi:hypothetical protein